MTLSHAQVIFLSVLAETFSAARAAVAAGWTLRQAIDCYNADAAFAAAWDMAATQAKARLEEIAYSRAVNGTERPVWHKGQLVGHETVHDNKLLMSMLGAALPMRYGAAGGNGRAVSAEQLHITIQTFADPAQHGTTAPVVDIATLPADYTVEDERPGEDRRTEAARGRRLSIPRRSE